MTQATPRDDRRQAGHRALCRTGAGLFASVFIQYYSEFTRFEAKHFLLEAARFMDGTCPVCVIDNTSVIVADGTGADAVIAPEMVAFARTLGFRFQAHSVGHADRKGRIERPFFMSKPTSCRHAASAASRISTAKR
jgi:hypothetical protein